MNNNQSKPELTLEEYNKQRQSNALFLLKICIVFLGLIILFIVVFFFMLKSNISSIKSMNSEMNNKIEVKEKENMNNEKEINKRLVSLYVSPRVFHYEYLQIIKNEEEYNKIMEWTESKYSEAYLCFSNTAKSGYSYYPFHFCQYDKVLVFIFRTYQGHRFGGAVFNFTFEDNGIVTDEQAFLFNMETGKVFKVKDPDNAYSFNKDEDKLIFGDEDLVIDFQFKNQRCYSKFPRNYGNSDSTLYDLLGEEAVNENISVNGLEILGKFNF